MPRSRRKFWKSFPDSKGEGLRKMRDPQEVMTRAQNVALSPGSGCGSDRKGRAS